MLRNVQPPFRQQLYAGWERQACVFEITQVASCAGSQQGVGLYPLEEGQAGGEVEAVGNDHASTKHRAVWQHRSAMTQASAYKHCYVCASGVVLDNMSWSACS